MQEEIFHILPINDLKEHTESEFCECNPVFEDNCWIHNSFDGREKLERLTDFLTIKHNKN